MKVYQSLAAYEAGPRTVATIGTFDGVHIGHRTILERLVQSAREAGGESVLISFHPHPRLVLFPENNPLRLLHTLDEKIAMLDQIGLDKLLLIPFTRDFSRMSSRQFIRNVLVDTVRIHKIVIGYDHHFGKNRTGGIEELQSYAEDWGYEVEEIPALSIDDAKVSSTKIRLALQEGDVTAAAKYLGYPYSFAGTVVHGEKKGRELGFPTANLEPDLDRKLIPANGIYFVRIYLPDGTAKFGLMSIGHKPTMGEFDRSQEVWIYEYHGDLYGQQLRVEMLTWMRGEVKFDSLEALIGQMNQDKALGYQLMEAYQEPG